MIEPVAVVGAGPAGLFAAETIALGGRRVVVFDQMPSPARKFLMAGRGGLNLTHSEPVDLFLQSYPGAPSNLLAAIRAFPPDSLVAWCHSLGVDTFVGSSGRVFPKAMKASPLLRAWLQALRGIDVEIRTRHRWTGIDDDLTLHFETPAGAVDFRGSSVVLAVGGASWPKLGSDGRWTHTLNNAGIATTSFQPSNCGVLVPWSAFLQERFAGTPLKRIAVSCGDRTSRGELVLTKTGLEGGGVYALSNEIRDQLHRKGAAALELDLRPDLSHDALTERLARLRGRQSMANHLRKSGGLDRIGIALLREVAGPGSLDDPQAAAALIKSLPIQVTALAGIDRAISSVGGLTLDAVDDSFMLKSRPGVFVAGEMLDWDAPTGGYLLQACFATGRAAGLAATRWLQCTDANKLAS